MPRSAAMIDTSFSENEACVGEATMKRTLEHHEPSAGPGGHAASSIADQVVHVAKSSRAELLAFAEAVLPESRPLSEEGARAFAQVRRGLFKPL